MDPNIEKIIELEKEKSELEIETIYLYQALCNILSIASVNGQAFYVANSAVTAYEQHRK